jgi:hypothetical protein
MFVFSMSISDVGRSCVLARATNVKRTGSQSVAPHGDCRVRDREHEHGDRPSKAIVGRLTNEGLLVFPIPQAFFLAYRRVLEKRSI